MFDAKRLLDQFMGAPQGGSIRAAEMTIAVRISAANAAAT